VPKISIFGRRPSAVLTPTLMRWVAPLGDSPVRPSGSAPATVEVAQNHVGQPVGSTGVAQHDLGHQLGGTVRPCRHGGIFPPHRHTRGIAVDRRGRGKDEMAHAARDRSLD
jgi:hypothetical protein